MSPGIESCYTERGGSSPLKAFACSLARLFALFSYPVRVHSLGEERRGNGGDANEAPALIGVFHKFSDNERRKYARCLYPVARAIRGMRIVKGLTGQLQGSVRCGVMRGLRHGASFLRVVVRPSL